MEYHQLALDLEPGAYRLVVQDEEGFTRSVQFEAFKKVMEVENPPGSPDFSY